MKTLFTICMLMVMGLIANYLAAFILNIAGIPGALLAGIPGQRSKLQFRIGVIMSAIGQSYFYLAYTAFVVNWTRLAVSIQGASWFVWIAAFLAVVMPLMLNLSHAMTEARESKIVGAPVEGLNLTVWFAVIGFFVFVFFPNIAKQFYGWIPCI